MDELPLMPKHFVVDGRINRHDPAETGAQKLQKLFYPPKISVN